RRLVLGGRDPGEQLGRRVVHRVAHPERAGDVGGDVLVEALAGDPLDDLAERDEPEVAVDVAGARLARRCHVPHAPEGGGLVGRAPQVDPGRQTGGVGEQLLDGDRLLAVRREGGDVGGGGVREVDLAALDELHDRDGGEELGQGGEVEDRVRAHLDLLVGGQLGGRVRPPHRVPHGAALDDDPLGGDEGDG